jgi:predicted phosphoribosyltransferase
MYPTRFADRHDAGRQLAEHLEHYRNHPDLLVLALPRGGVPVAWEIARALHAPLDVMIVRKLGLPGHEELAMGAIASGGVRVMNDAVIEALAISADIVERVARQEEQELRRRDHVYREGHPPFDAKGKTVILVDDGIATGATIRVAAKALRRQHPAAIIIATPTVAEATARSLQKEVDEVVCVMSPKWFVAIGDFYEDFLPVSDEEVRRLLRNPTVETRTS